MLLFVAVLLVGGYAVIATRAARRGYPHLALVAASALGLIVVAATLLGLAYAVPSIPRVVVYTVAFFWPVVIVPTVVLAGVPALRQRHAAALTIAVVAAIVGLCAGWMLAVFGLRGW